MATLEEIFANLDDSTKRAITVAKDFKIERIPTPSLGLNAALGGGLVSGSQTLVWGPKSAGKTTFTLLQIAIAQKHGKQCAFMDVEGTFDPEWAQRLGVDIDELIVVNTRTINNFTDQAVALIKAGIDVLVIDSITALMPASYINGDDIKKMEETGQLGSLAAGVSKAMSMINGANIESRTSIIIISQARFAKKGMHWGFDSTGGEALKFYSSTVIRLNSTNGDSNKIFDGVELGDKIINKQVGRKVTWVLEYCKTAPQGTSDEYNLIFDGDNVGIDNVSEMIDIGFTSGVLEKKGNWYWYKDHQLGNGKAKATKFLSDPQNEALRQEIEGEINGG